MVWDKVRLLFFVILVGTATGRPSDDEERRSDQGTQVNKAINLRQPKERPAATFDEVLPKHNFPGALAARDRTARMDLVKSIDDILQSPYDGPLLTSLEPLLLRNSISRLTRDSNNFRREPSPPLPSGNDPFSVPFSSRPARPFSSSFSESNVVNPQSTSSFRRPFDQSNAARPQSTSSFRRPFDESNRVSSSPTTSFRRPFEESGTQIQTSERLRRRPQPSKSSHFEPSDPDSFHESFRPVKSAFESRPPPSISQPSSSFTRFIENPTGGLQSSFSRRPEENSGTFSNDFFNHHTRRQRRATTNHEESFFAGESTHEKSDRRSFSDSSPVYGKELSNTAAFETKTDGKSFRMDPLNSKTPLAREESQGFIVGKPSSFPDFQSLGGFGPMDPIGTKASNFVPSFNAPSVAIPDISDKQPELTPENFPSYQAKNGNASDQISDKKELSSYIKEEPTAQESQHRGVVARKGAVPEGQFSHSRVTRQFSSFPYFDFTNERRDRAESRDPHRARDGFTGPRNPQQQQPQQPQQPQPRGFNKQETDAIVPQSQRFYPSFNQNPRKTGSRHNQAFYPSGTHPGARGGGPVPFASHRPNFRSHGGQKAVHGPKFAFASNTFKDYGPVDNSILGSGNFEIIRGGTFYDENNPHRNHNPYDPYLDNSYVVFPTGNPHNHNHVDDFFSNFRDFSEFATRRSGSMHGAGPDDGYLEPGYASEHVAQVSRFDDLITSESSSNNNTHTVVSAPAQLQSKTEAHKELGKAEPNPSKIVILARKEAHKDSKPRKSKKYNANTKKSSRAKAKINKRPNNIQDVLEEIDPLPSAADSIKLQEEEDPLIAIY